MSFMKNWKGPTAKSNVSALNPSKLQEKIMPEQNSVESVKPVDNQMTKFRGLKRQLAKDRNLFKQSKD